MWLRNIKESDQCLYVGYMMAIAIIFYILNVCTPHYMDDWNYCFKFGTTYVNHHNNNKYEQAKNNSILSSTVLPYRF